MKKIKSIDEKHHDEIFFNCFNAFQELSFKKTKKKHNSMKIFLLTMKK